MMKRSAKTGWKLIQQVSCHPAFLSLGLLSLLAVYSPANAQTQDEDLVIDNPAVDSLAPAANPPTAVPVAPSEPAFLEPPPAPQSAPSTAAREAYSESYIDTTGYSLGATQRSSEQAASSAPGQASLPRYRVSAQPQAPGSVQIGPVAIGSSGLNVVGLSTPSSSEYYKRLSMRPPGPLAGNLKLIFPLSIPAPITSLFGWRVHPVTGVQRFHTGTDLGAPLGTPVLAAVAGRVMLADFLGGYGLTVALEHNQGQQQTLYGHLSEIFVRPGEQVKQGSVIGRVGSTGVSTGPHLHFEFRQLTPEGWVAMDAGTQLEYALAQLVKAFNLAQANPNQRLDLLPPGRIGKLEAGAEG